MARFPLSNFEDGDALPWRHVVGNACASIAAEEVNQVGPALAHLVSPIALPGTPVVGLQTFLMPGKRGAA